ncbi:MAG: DNA polymerase IV, partial [Luteimonas sp.]|nr:DNA polymerase IV [Luteimonas sp.]
VKPAQVRAFLTPLPVAKIHGVGKVMEKKLAELGIATVGDLRTLSAEELEARFGSFGRRLHLRAQGIDERAVQPDQPVQSISAEDTFERDLLLDELEPAIVRMAEKAWLATRKTERVGRTVVLKLKTAQFRILTRSLTPDAPPASLEAFTAIALSLLSRVDLPPSTRYRLVGVGLSGFRDREEVAAQPELVAATEP